ncbi:hypothetical protein KCP74_08975 [Salmonella enterica subsp. enterica]|nr:hypothetical protein KCP74_08975 [Salmonella enterica subsp. enterica]
MPSWRTAVHDLMDINAGTIATGEDNQCGLEAISLCLGNRQRRKELSPNRRGLPQPAGVATRHL